MNSSFFKRIFDFIIALVLLIFSLPILIFFSFTIFIFHRQNPIFTQQRSGKNGIAIKIYKLTTMKSKNSKKFVTNIGKILRKLKIDELPQLFNVIEGSLSLIGPRPLYLEFNDHLSKKHYLRLKFKPGITGLAQVKVSDNTNWNKKFNYDVFYVKNYSFKLDIYVLYLTIVLIFNIFKKKENIIIESYDYLNDFYRNYKK